MTNVTDLIITDFQKKTEKKKWFLGKNLESARKLQVEPRFRRLASRVVQTMLGRTYFFGRQSARKELERQGIKFKYGVGADLGYPEVDVGNYLSPSFLRRWLQEMDDRLDPAARKAIATFANYKFFVTDEFDAGLLKQARDVIFTQATQNPGRHIMEQLRERMEGYSHNHLVTIVRTNSSRAFADGRMSEFEKAEDDGDIAGYRYSTVMDGDQTPYCGAHDGKMISSNNELFGEAQIPNNFNCRAAFTAVVDPDEFVDNWNDGVAPANQHPPAGFGA